jgi:putative nucleotidyltransferase with HDIG domain
MATPNKLAVDEAKIKKAILSGLPLTVTTFTLPHEIEVYIGEVIVAFLKLARQEKLRDYVCYCVQELAVNAKKANTKRVYFNERGLDIANPDDYKKGMELFKNITLNNIAHYLKLQKEKGLYVKLVLQIRENALHIEIRNNATITRSELIRIHDRLARSQEYNNLDEAFSQVLDDSEGSGLGLVILILMLKKIGLNESSFDIHSNEIETVAQIMIPLDQVQIENVEQLSRAIANSITSLPQFPEKILALQKLLSSETADMGTIAKQLSMDPALTADLLKTVNSAQYILNKKIDSITEAVKIIGIRGIKNLLFSYGTQQILGNDSAEKKLLWEHSYKTAFYAYNLAKSFKRDRNLLDDVYVCGILHDMGKIVFSNIHPKLLDNIRNFCFEKKIPNSIFEDLAAGMNHAEIGTLIAKKWNFPEQLIAAIHYHHDPLSAPEEYRDLVECVYLANMFCHYENGKAHFVQFEGSVLASFGISDKSQADSLLERLAQGFKKANE